MIKVAIQRGWSGPGDHRLGIVIDKRRGEHSPTIDICYWWGWFMIHFYREPYNEQHTDTP